MGDAPERRCTGCGAKIVFVRNQATGLSIPAQPVRTVYALVENLVGESELQKIPRPKPEQLFISHFETCPLADQFSGGKRS